MQKALKKVEAMLQEAATRRTWGQIEIHLKDGHPILLRQTIQSKFEDYPDAATSKQ